MYQRFSIRRAASDIGRILTERWLGLVVVTVLFGIAIWSIGGWLSRLPIPFASDSETIQTGRLLAGRLLQTGTEALMAGAILHVALRGNAVGAPADWIAPFRTALYRFPAVFTALLIIASPIILNIVLTGLWISALPSYEVYEISTATTVAKSSMIAGIISLIVYVFVGLAPAAAVAEDLGVKAALSRGLALTKERTLLILGFFVAALLVIMALAAPIAYFMVKEEHRIFAPFLTAIVAPLVITAKALGLAALFLELRRLIDAPPHADTASSQ